MATIQLYEGTKVATSLDLEEGEVIIYGLEVDKKNHVTVMCEPELGCLNSLLKVVTLGIMGFFLPKKTKWKASIVVTNKRLVSIPYSQTKTRTVQSWYYNTNLTNEVVAHNHSYAENTLPMPQIIFRSSSVYKDKPLVVHVIFEFSRRLGSITAKEWGKVGSMAAKKVAAEVGKSVNQAADMAQQSAAQMDYNSAGSYADRSAIQAQWSKDHSYNQKWAKVWEESGKVNLDEFDSAGDPTYARRDYVAQLINQCIEAAKG